MRIVIAVICVLFSIVLPGQSVCDSLQILQVNVDAFNSNRINIKVNNTSTDIFDYPGFRIYDEDQNLIGEEEVWFFGIAGESVHVVEFNPSDYVFEPFTNYNLSLELWVGFYSELKCAFNINATMLPQPIDCVDVKMTFSEFSSIAASYEIQLSHSNGAVIHSEELLFQPNVGIIERLFCLFPGCFELSASTEIAPDFSHLNVNMEVINSYGFLFSPLLDQQQENTLPFGIWSECSPLNTGELQNDHGFILYPNPANDQVFIEGTSNAILELYNNLGVLVQIIHYQAHQITSIDIETYAHGIYHLRSKHHDHSFSLSFIKE